MRSTGDPELDAQLLRFGENMRRARKEAGLSQIGLSERADLDRAAISFLERAERAPDLSTIVRVAAAARVPPAALFAGIGPPELVPPAPSEPPEAPRPPGDGAQLAPAARFGVNLRAARHRVGISQETLAADAQVDRAAISIFEHGRRDPNLRTLLRLARALDIPPGALLHGVEASAAGRRRVSRRSARSPAIPPTRR
jgi:transcriptional regulator with XRE-family HTH domain